jgi:hypothetical protein
MHLGLKIMRPRSIQNRDLAPSAAPVGAWIDQHGVEFAISSFSRHADSPRGASGRVLVSQVLYLLMVGTSIRGHDVSGTA